MRFLFSLVLALVLISASAMANVCCQDVHGNSQVHPHRCLRHQTQVAMSVCQPPPPACDVFDYGAKGNGTANDTKSIQAAIDDCASQGGGTVSLHDGIFLSGTITLADNIIFTLSPTATLKGSVHDRDYPALMADPNNSQVQKNCQKALVYTNGANNVVIEGGGTIEGNGEDPHWLDRKHHDERTRPMAVYAALSSQVTIRHLTVKNAAMWGVVILESDHVQINNVIVDNRDAHYDSMKPKGRTRDGIDIVDSEEVLIEDTTVSSEDDSICVKSGLPAGAPRSGVRNLSVRHCWVLGSQAANGLKLGTASQGSFRHIHFDTITVKGVKQAAMAVESVDGAAISDVTFNNIKISESGSLAYLILGAREKSSVGSISNVRFENIVGATLNQGSAISGTNGTGDGVTYYPTNIFFKNVRVTVPGGLQKKPPEPVEFSRYDPRTGKGMYPDPKNWGILPAYGFFLRHLKNVKFDSSSIEASLPDVRTAIHPVDVTGSGF